jgi:DNA-binding SARP family transcriptional activator
MQFCLLGPVELWNVGERVELGPMKQRTVLAALLADAGYAVGPDVLIDRVWGELAPAQVRNVLHTYITRLRGVLGRLDVGPGEHRPRLLKQPAGYLLDVDPLAVDLMRFRWLADRARAGSCVESEQARLLREPIDLWRAEPLAGCAGEWVAQSRDAWRLEHRDAVMRWARVLIHLGQSAEAVAPLERLVTDHALVEPVLDLLMRALHGAGRDPEALDRYESGRRLLADELGVDPGPKLRQLRRAILRGEVPDRVPVPAVVAQIPAGVASFVGRDAQLSRLDQMLADGQPNQAVISAVHGTAGVGKTALAVHWARRVADRFPDGQLYVDLRGFTAAST